MFEAQVLAPRVSLFSLLVIGLAATGCAPRRYAVRLRTADSQVRTTTSSPRPPVALTDEQVRKAVQVLAPKIVPVTDPLELARQQFEVPIRSGSYFFNPRTKQLTPMDDATAASELLPPELLEQARQYLQWCEHRRQPGDCLRVLGRRRILDQHGRYAVAMAIAISHTLEATKDSLKEMADPVAVTAMVVGGITMYAVLWALPEPVSKGIAAGMTVVLVAYFGVDTLYTLGRGWKTLIDRADEATTFDQLRAAGVDFAEVMGANNARILVMVATAAVGGGANAGKNALVKIAS